MTHRNVRALAALIAIVAAGGCNEQQLAPGISRDLTPPVVTISRTAGDSVDVTQGLSFSVLAQDNLALRAVSIALTGGFTRNIDTTFAGTVTATATIPVSQRFAHWCSMIVMP